MAYESLTLAQFLAQVLKAYPTVKTSLLLITDGLSAEYAAFHQKAIAAHTGLIRVKQAGVTYQIARVSNIRGSTGYTRYILDKVKVEPLEANDPNVTYCIYIDEWLDWVTIPL